MHLIPHKHPHEYTHIHIHIYLSVYLQTKCIKTTKDNTLASSYMFLETFRTVKTMRFNPLSPPVLYPLLAGKCLLFLPFSSALPASFRSSWGCEGILSYASSFSAEQSEIMNNGEEKGRLSFRFCLWNKRRKVAGICYEYGFGFHAFFCYSFMVFIEACAGGE